jgi:hypothetical protein
VPRGVVTGGAQAARASLVGRADPADLAVHGVRKVEDREPEAPRHRRPLQPEPRRKHGGVRVELSLHPPPMMHPRQAGRGADGPRFAWSPRHPARSGRGAALVAPPLALTAPHPLTPLRPPRAPANRRGPRARHT